MVFLLPSLLVHAMVSNKFPEDASVSEKIQHLPQSDLPDFLEDQNQKILLVVITLSLISLILSAVGFTVTEIIAR